MCIRDRGTCSTQIVLVIRRRHHRHQKDAANAETRQKCTITVRTRHGRMYARGTTSTIMVCVLSAPCEVVYYCTFCSALSLGTVLQNSAQNGAGVKAPTAASRLQPPTPLCCCTRHELQLAFPCTIIHQTLAIHMQRKYVTRCRSLPYKRF